MQQIEWRRYQVLELKQQRTQSVRGITNIADR